MAALPDMHTPLLPAGAYAAAVDQPTAALAHQLLAAKTAPDELSRVTAVIQVQGGPCCAN